MTNNVISRIGNVQPGTYSIEISATDDTTTLTDTLPIYVESVGDPTFTVKTENPNLWVGDGTSITCEYAYHN
ncbi:hypothetical protein FACS1894166_09710 [Bacilli bacterium]|nr:hypothetical protein FACS1894166_09710 [Bacilli bacterium]